jgi:hypothetical protein
MKPVESLRLADMLTAIPFVVIAKTVITMNPMSIEFGFVVTGSVRYVRLSDF